jgi:hypothetical protein
MGKRYDQPKAGEMVIPSMQGYKMACCDCGLVHRLQFAVKVAKPSRAGRFTLDEPRNKHPLQVTFTTTIDKRATAAMRRNRP